MKCNLVLLCLVLGLNSAVAHAAKDTSGITDMDKLNVNSAMDKISKQAGKKFIPTDIKITPIPGLLEVTVDSNIIYIYNGKYAISGEILDLSKDKKSWSNTEQALRGVRKKMLAELDPKEMIIFPATSKKLKANKVIVFTDIDCAFCHKLQENIKQYTDQGIEIRYLAFPRTGPDSPSFYKAVTVWCSDDPKRDLSLSMQGKDLPKNQCVNNPVAKQFEFGLKIGINGTPTMILENGQKAPGLLSPDELVKLIKEQGN